MPARTSPARTSTPLRSPLLAVGDYAGWRHGATFEGPFIHAGPGVSMNLTDTADAATELQSRTVWTEMVLNGNASNGTRVDGVTTARGGFDFFHSDPLPQHVIDFGAEATLEAGDRVEIVYNDTGSLLHDHGNTNVFLGVVPAPATAGLLAAGALIGLRRKR